MQLEKLGKKGCLHELDLLCSKSFVSVCVEYMIFNVYYSSKLLFSLVVKLSSKTPNIRYHLNREIILAFVWKNKYFLLNPVPKLKNNSEL